MGTDYSNPPGPVSWFYYFLKPAFRFSGFFLGFYRLLEPFKVAGDGLAELVELGEEVFDSFKLDRQLTGLETYPLGPGLHFEGGFFAYGNFDGRRLEVLAGPFDLICHILAALEFVMEVLISRNLFELPDQGLPVYQKGFA